MIGLRGSLNGAGPGVPNQAGLSSADGAAIAAATITRSIIPLRIISSSITACLL
jgi:hypothetical protein